MKLNYLVFRVELILCDLIFDHHRYCLIKRVYHDLL